MHWFWRAVMTVIARGGVCALIAWRLFTHPSTRYQADYVFVFVACVVVPITTVALDRGLSVAAGDPHELMETRCRKCRYILRSLSEPRCPECGEKI